jgi:hypothetical protein
MRKTDTKTISELVSHAQAHPEQSYRELAASFGISEVSVKRYCATIGRGKNWRKDRKKVEDTGAARLWAAVDKLGPDDCWEWKGARNRSGYGFLHFRGKSQGAHRVAYELTHGKIPEGIELDHLCRNRLCCNPAHLEPISHDENMRRVRVAKAKTEAAFQDASPCLMDPASIIDTAQRTTNEIRFNAAPTIVNGDKLHQTHRPQIRVAVSTNSKPEGPKVLAYRAQVERELKAKQDAEDMRWGLIPKQLSSKARWDGELHVYLVNARFVSEEDSVSEQITARILARSKDNATEMVESIWGRGFSMNATKIGFTRGQGEIADWLSGWRKRLRQQFKEWKATDHGKRCFDRVQAETKAKELAEVRRQNEERAFAAYEAEWEEYYVAEARAQRSAQFKRSSHPQSRRIQTDEPEAYEFGAEEAQEMDY